MEHPQFHGKSPSMAIPRCQGLPGHPLWRRKKGAGRGGRHVPRSLEPHEMGKNLGETMGFIDDLMGSNGDIMGGIDEYLIAKAAIW